MSEQVMKSQEIPRNRRKFATILNIPKPFFGTLFVGHFFWADLNLFSPDLMRVDERDEANEGDKGDEGRKRDRAWREAYFNFSDKKSHVSKR